LLLAIFAYISAYGINSGMIEGKSGDFSIAA